MYPKNIVDLSDSYLDATWKSQRYLELDLSHAINDILRFRAEIFRDECPFPLIYTHIDYGTDRSTYHTLHVLKAADSILFKAIIANCNQETLKSTCKCALDVLRGNFPMSA